MTTYHRRSRVTQTVAIKVKATFAGALFVCTVLGACRAPRAVAGTATAPASAPPAFFVGAFEDDYGERYSVSATEWVQLPRGRYHSVRWNVAEQYLIAQNDSTNRGAPGRWTRIDWLELTGMPPYSWGFCYSAFNAVSTAQAESTMVVHREAPRTGCNGYPFSRMKRVTWSP
jgi:hypothetical protein